jgi:hypothetical protein
MGARIEKQAIEDAKKRQQERREDRPLVKDGQKKRIAFRQLGGRLMASSATRSVRLLA